MIQYLYNQVGRDTINKRISALKQEIDWINSPSGQDILSSVGGSRAGIKILGIKLSNEVAVLTVNGAADAISSTPVDVGDGFLSKLASTISRFSGTVSDALNGVSDVRTIDNLSKVYDERSSYSATYECA